MKHLRFILMSLLLTVISGVAYAQSNDGQTLVFDKKSSTGISWLKADGTKVRIGESEGMQILGTEYENFSRNFTKIKRARRTMIAGDVLAGLGAGAMVYGLLGGNTPALFAGSGTFTAGAVCVIVGACKSIRGGKKLTATIEQTNARGKTSMYSEPVQFNFGFTSNGLGATLNF